MSKLTLFHSHNSPYVRKVTVLAQELGIADEIVHVTSAGSALDPGTMPVAENPLGKVPTLTRPDGGALYDSRVICRYLDARAGGRSYPAPPRLWDALTLEATGDGILDAALAMVYEDRLRPEEIRFAPYVEGQWRRIERTLDTLEARWMAYLAGPLCIGQISLGCALGYLDFRLDARDWRKGRAALSDWHARFAARESYIATQPPA